MNTYQISLSPRVEQEIEMSKEFQQEILRNLARFTQGDWGSVSNRMQKDNDEIFTTNQPTKRTYSIFGILREPVYEIFACYPLTKGGVIWMIRDVRFEEGPMSQPRIAVLHPLEYGHWAGPYFMEPAAV